MNIITPPPQAATHPLTQVFAFLLSDAHPFAGDVRIDASSGRIFARHRSGEGEELGWECHQLRPDGRVDATYSRGRRTGLVAARAPGSRLRLTEGAIAAVAARSLLPPGDDPVWVVGLGGAWNGEVARHLETLVARGRIRIIEVGNSTHHPAGRAMRAAALGGLAAMPVDVVDYPAPEDDWFSALRRTRLLGEKGR